MEKYKCISMNNGKMILKSDTGKQITKKIYRTSKSLSNGGLLGNYYIIHNKEKIYFNNNFIKILTK